MPKGRRGGGNGQPRLGEWLEVVELPENGRRRGSEWPMLRRWSGKTSQRRAKKASAIRAGKLSYKNQPRVGKSKKEGIVEEDTRATARLEKVFTLKLPNRYINTSIRESGKELL